jgi:hypothetical protein
MKVIVVRYVTRVLKYRCDIANFQNFHGAQILCFKSNVFRRFIHLIIRLHQKCFFLNCCNFLL